MYQLLNFNYEVLPSIVSDMPSDCSFYIGFRSDRFHGYGEQQGNGPYVEAVAHVLSQHFELLYLAFFHSDFGYPEGGRDFSVFHSLLKAHAQEGTVF